MKKLIYLIVVIVALSFIVAGCTTSVVPPAEQGNTENLTKGNILYVPSVYSTIQAAINAAALSGDTINVAAGTYEETLNLLGKELSIIGVSVDTVIIDASLLAGYAIHNFGNNTTIKNLKLIGTSNSYGFKVSHVNNILLENIKVDSSYKTGVDFHTVADSELKDIEVINTVKGFGIMILDSDDIDVSNIKTVNNYWGGTSVQTAGKTSDGVVFSGTFDANEDMPFMVQKDPPNYHDIINLVAPSCFNYIVYAYRLDGCEQSTFKKTLYDAKTFAQMLITAPFYFSNIMIYDLTKDNYYVIEGMLIQDAINDATTGDTINVAAGTYIEQIRITKPLTLISDTGDYRTSGTILTGDTTIFLDAHTELGGVEGLKDVTIQGFRFENISVDLDEGTIRDGEGDNVNYINILSNSFYNITGPAIKSYITTNADGWIINDNKIEDIIGNGMSGMAIFNLQNSTISNNQISDTMKAGILLDGAEDIVVSGNRINNVPEQGIQVGYTVGETSPSSDITIINNLVTFANTSESSNKGGICIYPSQNNITITGNTLTENFNGITVRNKSGAVAVDVYVNFNNIYGNDGFGVGNFAQGGGMLDATCNWWGHASGPSGEGLGTGDAVSTFVNFDPWLGKGFIELIQDDFKNEKAWSGQQKALLNKMEVVSKQIKNGAYQSAINKLQNDVLDKIERWIDDPPREDLIEEVEAIIMILEGLLV